MTNLELLEEYEELRRLSHDEDSSVKLNYGYVLEIRGEILNRMVESKNHENAENMKDYESMVHAQLIAEYGRVFHISTLKALAGVDHAEDDKELSKLVQELFKRILKE